MNTAKWGGNYLQSHPPIQSSSIMPYTNNRTTSEVPSGSTIFMSMVFVHFGIAVISIIVLGIFFLYMDI